MSTTAPQETTTAIAAGTRLHALDGPRDNTARALIALIGIGVAARLLWFLGVHAEPVADYAFYLTRAIQLAAGEGYNFQGHPTAFFPVGTSLVLAGFFVVGEPTLATARLATFCCGLALVALTYLLAARLASRHAALWAAAIVAVHPDLIVLSGLVASENFLLPALLATLWVSWLCARAGTARPLLWALCGLLLGLTILIRSTTIILLPVFLLCAALQAWPSLRRAASACAVIVLGVAAVLGPWVARNAVVMGQPVLSTNGGISLWWGNNPAASGGFPLSVPQPVQDLRSTEAELASNARYSAQAFEFIRTSPAAWLRLIPNKLDYLFSAVSPDLGFWTMNRYVGGPDAIEYHPRLGDPRGEALAQYERRTLSPLESKLIGAYLRVASAPIDRAANIVLWVVGIAGLTALALRRRSAAVALLFAAPVIWLVFHATLANGQPRYLLSVTPLVAIGVGHVLAGFTLRRRARAAHESEAPGRP